MCCLSKTMMQLLFSKHNLITQYIGGILVCTLYFTLCSETSHFLDCFTTQRRQFVQHTKSKMDLKIYPGFLLSEDKDKCSCKRQLLQH